MNYKALSEVTRKYVKKLRNYQNDESYTHYGAHLRYTDLSYANAERCSGKCEC